MLVPAVLAAPLLMKMIVLVRQDHSFRGEPLARALGAGQRSHARATHRKLRPHE